MEVEELTAIGIVELVVDGVLHVIVRNDEVLRILGVDEADVRDVWDDHNLVVRHTLGYPDNFG